MTDYETYLASDDVLDNARAWAIGNPECVLDLYLQTATASGDYERWKADQIIGHQLAVYDRDVLEGLRR